MNTSYYISNTDTNNLNISYEIVQPIASYVALACVLFFIFILIVSRLVITTEKTKSDLILFNQSPQKHLELLVSKQASNAGAMNNIHAAVALGLMIPPPNYEPPIAKDQSKPNGFANHNNNSKLMDANEAPVSRAKKSKW
ncbi:unnamed protein product [Brachionus calyciflorus]|uniref:Uncharacterized protein n=1 Tax=Brachionus calyciflorus TaxID=104777 RepID=A0A813QIV9_9BILA|nr:unnamed protein product [Brachionus calyciflorus]